MVAPGGTDGTDAGGISRSKYCPPKKAEEAYFVVEGGFTHHFVVVGLPAISGASAVPVSSDSSHVTGVRARYT